MSNDKQQNWVKHNIKTRSFFWGDVTYMCVCEGGGGGGWVGVGVVWDGVNIGFTQSVDLAGFFPY